MTSTIIYHHTPYVYIIRHIPSGKFYAGSRTAKGCHPSDLWTKYFTSSNYVKELIGVDKVNSFQVLMIFECPNKASTVEFESLLLNAVGAANSSSWLNMSNADGKFCASSTMPEAVKLKISASLKGRKLGPQSPEHIEKLANIRRGRIQTSSSNSKRSTTLKGKLKSEEQKEKMRKPKSDGHRLKMSIANKLVPKKLCLHCMKEFKPGPYARFHGNRCKLV